jgi:hypothetical protein
MMDGASKGIADADSKGARHIASIMENNKVQL